MLPYSSFNPISADERKILMNQSIVAGVYEQHIDRENAYEILQQKVAQCQQQAITEEAAKQQAKRQEALAKQQTKEQDAYIKQQAREQQNQAERVLKQREKMTQDIVGTFAKSAARSKGGSTGQKIIRGLLGPLFGRK